MMKKIVVLFCMFSLTSAVSSQVLLLTLPKTGTNLVLKLLRTMLNQHSQYNVNNVNGPHHSIVWGHEWKLETESVGRLEPNKDKLDILKKRGTKLILLLRDPRQHITSLLRSIKKPVTSDTINWGIDNFPEMMARQTGQKCFRNYQDINDCYQSYLRWAREYGDVYITTYEKLVGPRGGGSDALQREEVKNIAKFLGISLNNSKVQNLALSLYGNTSTFVEGKTSTWKDKFSLENKKIFKQKAQPLLTNLGYEVSENW